MLMANHAYLRVWTRDFSLEKMIPELARFLTTAPLSSAHDTFDELIVQAVDPGESPIAEWDLRPLHAGPAEVAAMAAQHLHSDTAYIASATWDLWAFDIDTLKWQRKPQPLELSCHGLDYDDGMAASAGHFKRTWGSSISSPAMADCFRPRPRIIPPSPSFRPTLSILRNTPSSTLSGSGWPRVTT